MKIICTILLCWVACISNLAAQEEPTATPDPTPENVPSVVVFLPERIDQEWFWYYFTSESQHVVQSVVEKALLDAGFTVLDISSQPPSGTLDTVLSPDQARELAQKMGAQYMIWGKAIGDKKSDSMAYGVRVVRATATITARLVRVSDGRVLASEETSAEEGGQALRAAARDALKKAAQSMARKMTKALQSLQSPPS